DVELHRSDAAYGALQAIAVGELRDARGRPGGDQRAGLERRDARKKTDEIAQPVDHVRGVRLHHGLAILRHVDAHVLRFGDLVRGHDPRPQPAEGIEALADVARVVAALPPRVADADVPAHRVAVDVIERLLRRDLSRGAADDGAELAFVIHMT